MGGEHLSASRHLASKLDISSLKTPWFSHNILIDYGISAQEQIVLTRGKEEGILLRVAIAAARTRTMHTMYRT